MMEEIQTSRKSLVGFSSQKVCVDMRSKTCKTLFQPKAISKDYPRLVIHLVFLQMNQIVLTEITSSGFYLQW